MMEEISSAPPPTLNEMFIISTDALNGNEIDLRVTPGWNDRPPLLVEKGNWRKPDRPEDPVLLKGVSIFLVHLSFGFQCRMYSSDFVSQ